MDALAAEGSKLPCTAVSNQQLLYPRHHRIRKIYIMLTIAGNCHIGHCQVTNAIFKIGDHLVAIDGYKHDIQRQHTRFKMPIEVLLELHQRIMRQAPWLKPVEKVPGATGHDKGPEHTAFADACEVAMPALHQLRRWLEGRRRYSQ